MGRSSRDQRGQFSTMVRYDGRGRIIPGSNILKKGQKPHEGKWQKKDAYECCNSTPTTTSTTTVNPLAIGTFYSGKDKSLKKAHGKRKMLTSVVILYLRHLLFQQYHGYKHKLFQN